MDRVAVVGLGLIGGSIAKRLMREPHARSVVGYDSDSAALEAAAAEGLEVAGSLQEAARNAGLVVVCVPPPATAECVLTALAASPDVLVTDVASVKRPVVDRVIAQAERRGPSMAAAVERFLPGHPLAGSEAAGWAAARSELLDGGVWAICPPHAHAGVEPLAAFAPLFDALDARLLVCAPEAHDRAVALTSHAAHVVAQVLAATVGGSGSGLTAALSGPAFRDMTRVARSDAGLWRQVLAMNEDFVVEALAEWSARLDGLARVGDAAASTGAAQAGSSGDRWSALWDEGIQGRALVESLRWTAAMEWRQGSAPLPPWKRLLSLGERGVAVRRPRIEGGELAFEYGSRPT